MNTIADTMTEQIKQLAEIQQRSLEPMRAFGGFAVDAFEQMTRKNYALAGDVVDFSIRQSNLALKGDNPSETVSAQMAEGKAFAELMNRRASEYAELANDLGGKLRQVGNDATAALKGA